MHGCIWGVNVLKIAISTDGEYVSAHFGRCPFFTIAEIKDGQLVNKIKIDNPGHHPGFLPQFLKERGVSVIIAGGMGQRAQMLFDESGIKIMMGIGGQVEEVIKLCIKGTLQGGKSLCQPGAGKGYGIEKTACDHPHEDHDEQA